MDDLTIAYLDAGRRLVEGHCNDGLDSGDDEDRPAFRWLTRDLLFDDVSRSPHPLPRQASAGSYRDRWQTKYDFTADLVAYLFMGHQWAYHVEVATAGWAKLTDRSRSLAASIEETAYNDQVLITDSQYAGTFRAQLSLQSLAAHDEAIGEAVRLIYDQLQATWRRVYERVLHERGLRYVPT
jgi:hypothetical protein